MELGHDAGVVLEVLRCTRGQAPHLRHGHADVGDLPRDELVGVLADARGDTSQDRARSVAVIRGHGPSSNACRAAATAAATSSSLPSAARARTSFVAGFSVSNVAPDTLGRKRPSM